MVWQGENVITTARGMMGATNPKDANLGTIRGDFGLTVGKNIIHGSDSSESAVREIGLFFKEEELLEYSKLMKRVDLLIHPDKPSLRFVFFRFQVPGGRVPIDENQSIQMSMIIKFLLSINFYAFRSIY